MAKPVVVTQAWVHNKAGLSDKGISLGWHQFNHSKPLEGGRPYHIPVDGEVLLTPRKDRQTLINIS